MRHKSSALFRGSRRRKAKSQKVMVANDRNIDWSLAAIAFCFADFVTPFPLIVGQCPQLTGDFLNGGSHEKRRQLKYVQLVITDWTRELKMKHDMCNYIREHKSLLYEKPSSHYWSDGHTYHLHFL
jgi:hypothetical protein